jgi:hypothetical protein
MYKNEFELYIVPRGSMNNDADQEFIDAMNKVMDEVIQFDLELRVEAIIPIIRICCNSKCDWVGNESDCVTFKHDTEKFLCPECNEVTEIVNIL